MKNSKNIFGEILSINDDDWIRIEKYLVKNAAPVSDEDLFKIIVTCKAELNRYEGAKIFFSDVRYELNDKIVILKNRGLVEFGRIVKIEPKNNYLCVAHECSYVLPYCEIIHIEPLKGDWQSMAGHVRLISASKEQLQNKLVYLTRDELVDELVKVECKNGIQNDLMEQLRKEDRIISDGEKWFLKSHVPQITEIQIEEIFCRISDSAEPFDTGYILVNILNITLSSAEIELWRFAVEYGLGKDKRFMRKDTRWYITPPPRESIVTIDEDAINLGFLKVGLGLRHMLAYYKLKGEITFLTYGYYEISGVLSEDYKNISGQGIGDWYIENDLHAGDKIHVRCPSGKDVSLRLYTEIETKKAVPSRSNPESKQIHLRKLAYEFFLNKREYSVSADIKKGIELSQQVIIEESSLRSVLATNVHIFEKLTPSRNLWGLRIWGTEDKSKYINLNLLLLTIQEDDLVFKIIEGSEELLSNREIACRIAEEFCLPVDLILGTSFLNANDARIIRLPDGRLTLKVNFDNWEKRLLEINSYLLHHDQIEKQISELMAEAAVLKREVQELVKIIENKQENLSLEKSELIKLLETKLPRCYSFATRGIRYLIFFLLLISAMIILWDASKPDYKAVIITVILCVISLGLLMVTIFLKKNTETKARLLESSVKKSNKNIDQVSEETDKLELGCHNKKQLLVHKENEIEQLKKEILYEDAEKIELERLQIQEKMSVRK